MFNILIKHSRKGRRKKESQNIGWRGEDTTSGLKTKISFKSALLHNSVFMTVTVLHINPEVMPYDLTTDIKTVKYV